jgi:type VI secretion system protein ImpC
MAQAQEQAGQTAAAAEAAPSLLDEIIGVSKVARTAAEQSRTKDLIAEFVDQVLGEESTVSPDIIATIESRIAQLDELLSQQMNEILHAAEFQKLEGSWRGLRHLVFNSETSTTLKIRVLSASKKELLRDFKTVTEFDQSALFKKIYEDEYGMFGGAPYGALIGDYEFGRDPEDLQVLTEISHVAAAAHAPFISAASSTMFGFDSFTELGNPRDLAKIFDTVEYAQWKSFRESEDSRYVGLTLPHVLGRLPYGKGGTTVEAFNYQEDTDGKDHGKYLWSNAAYAFGTRLSDAFSRYGWCAAIRGVEGGGKVEGLPVHTFQTDEGDVALKCPTEIAITDRREKELADLGFMPLLHCKGTDYAAFFSAQSAQKSKVYLSDDANANARISTQLPYIFAVSRFAHYIKSMMRDKVGSFMSRADAQVFLNNWINHYVTEDDTASQATKCQFPLREARVDVTEIPGKPGAYRAVAFMRPHFQLDELTASLRMVADLPPPAKG